MHLYKKPGSPTTTLGGFASLTAFCTLRSASLALLQRPHRSVWNNVRTICRAAMLCSIGEGGGLYLRRANDRLLNFFGKNSREML